MSDRASQVFERVIQAAIALMIGATTLVPSAFATEVDHMSITGSFTDDLAPYLSNSTPVDLDTSESITFTRDFIHPPKLVTFNVDYIRTDKLGPDRYADVVTISYDSLAGTSFAGHNAFLSLVAYNAQHDILPLVSVIDFTKGSLGNPGWYADLSGLMGFSTYGGPGSADSAPDSASFTLSFLHLTPVPPALPLLATGLGALGLAGWRRQRGRPAVPPSER